MRDDPPTPDGFTSRRRMLKLAGATTAGAIVPFSHDATAGDRTVVRRPFSVTAADGTVLRGHVYLPGSEQRPVAPVLSLGPYWNNKTVSPDLGSGHAETTGPRVGSHASGIRTFPEAGFAFAAVNVRGTGISDGCFRFGAPIEIGDAYAVVEALADREWSTGRVGMWGGSFNGWTQSLAIAGSPPSLEAVVPKSSVIDLWTVLTRRGAPIRLGWTVASRTDANESMTVLPPRREHLTCPDRTRNWLANFALANSGSRSRYFASREYLSALANSRVPMLVTNGLDYTREGHIRQIEGLYESRPAETTHMVLGQFGHNETPEGFTSRVVAWFDHYLRDGPMTVEPGVVEYEDDTGTWHTADSWPPSSDRQSLYLSGTELVHDESAVGESRQRFQSTDTAPGLSREQCGPRQAVYASAPVARTLRIAGTAAIDVTLTSTLSDGNFAAVLIHTPGDGRCPDPEAADFGRALADLRHWKRPGEAIPFPVLDPTPVAFESVPFATEIPAGHRIVLVVGGGHSYLSPVDEKPTLAVRTGPDVPGSVTLPVVEGTLEFVPRGIDADPADRACRPGRTDRRSAGRNPRACPPASRT